MTAQFDLQGKTALVTGGAGILGQEFCMALASAGANVAVVDMNLDLAQTCVEKIKAACPEVDCLAVSADVSNKDSVTEMVAKAVEHFGAINILHNNAATKGKDLEAFFAPFEEYSLDVWQEIMSVNLDGVFLVAQAVGKQMIAQAKGGSVIQTSSIYGLAAPDQRIYEGSHYMGVAINTPAVYSASKAGVIGLSQYLATYWAAHNIRVNTLIPGGVSSGQNGVFQEKYANRVPLGRMADAEELCGALVFLASDASSYITGQSLVVDGGMTCW